MRFSSPHGLFQVKHRVVGLSPQAGHAFVEQRFHPLGDEGFAKILLPLRIGDDLIKPFYLVSHLNFQRFRLKRARIPDGLHNFSPHLILPPRGSFPPAPKAFRSFNITRKQLAFEGEKTKKQAPWAIPESGSQKAVTILPGVSPSFERW